MMIAVTTMTTMIMIIILILVRKTIPLLAAA